MLIRLRHVLAGVALVALVAAQASAQLAVAAASDLQPVLPEIAARFQRATGQVVRVSFGSSGNFVSQIQQGAPFDVFLSADAEYVNRLVASRHADARSVTGYATGRLALWSRTDRGLSLASGLSALADPRIRTIAIANPEHAPYGRAAVEALRRAGQYDRLRSRLVLGENVAQAAQFAQTGNADVAIVALSLTQAPGMKQAGSAVELPDDAYPRIAQTAVVLTRSRQAGMAARFLAFLGQPDILLLLRTAGFGSRP